MTLLPVADRMATRPESNDISFNLINPGATFIETEVPLDVGMVADEVEVANGYVLPLS